MQCKIGEKSALQGIWKMEEVNFKYITVQLGPAKMSEYGGRRRAGETVFFHLVGKIHHNLFLIPTSYFIQLFPCEFKCKNNNYSYK